MPDLSYAIDIADCKHSRCQEPSGLALVSIGNCLRRDDGIAQLVIDRLDKTILETLCRFDLGNHTNHLPGCLAHHQAAVVIDSTFNGLSPGTISIIDLSQLLSEGQKLKVQSCHGFSLVDELRIASKYSRLPDTLIFFGIEVEDVSFGPQISPSLDAQLPKIISKLSEIIETLLQRQSTNARNNNRRLSSG